MSSVPPTSNARATFLITLFITLLATVTIGFFVFLIGPAFLGVLGVMALVGVAHYFLWGRSMEHEVLSDSEVMDEPTPETNGWTTDGPHPPRRF
jgi:energy-coupling factor transporter transmembrane protein EcfT